MTHISDELPTLLTGEADRATVLAAGVHLRSCDDCRHELVSAVVSHASLASARRFAPELMTRTFGPAEEPTKGVDLPDLSALFAQVRDEAEVPPAAITLASRRRRNLALAVAAAAAVVVIGGGAAVIATSNDSHPNTHSIALAAYDVGKTGATGSIADDGTVKITAASLPAQDNSHRYEVWLTNSSRTRMQPVGWIGSNGTATMTIPKALLSQFEDIEVSVQDLHASTYEFSGTSVLRGSYST